MPTVGVHASVACRKCHANARFNLALAEPSRCESCHAGPHTAGQVMSKGQCDWCHSPMLATWKQTSFDHMEKTRFDLGGHKVLPCTSCHGVSTAKPSMACETCHANKSPHGVRFKAFDCASCHSTKFTIPSPKWPVGGFDHAKKTRFPLTGKHAALACRACHRGAGPVQFETLVVGCTTCHAHTRPHDQKFTEQQCTKCHR
jgi:hypothetical protein